MTPRVATGGTFVAALMVALMAVVIAATPACQPITEVVLVVDTDMTVPEDLDHITVTIEGTVTRSFDVNVGATMGKSFPLTLGLLRGGDATGGVVVTVDASAQSSPVLSQTARTSFVDGESRLLRMVLGVACLPVTCDGGQTCDAGTCQTPERPGRSLPPWSGVVPARPPRPHPEPIVGRSVWASGWHSAAMEGTTLYAWGENSDGQLGIGNTQNAKTRRPVMKVQQPLSVGLGQRHACVCDRTNQASCWGRNVEGQLGTGSLTPVLITPTVVPGVANCLEIIGGDSHICAVRTDNTVACWGNNSSGQVGQPAGGVVASPTPLVELTDVIHVGAGDRYTCALKREGTVLCWGENQYGQLGDGTRTTRSTPTNVMGLTDAVEIGVGRDHACARRMSGTVVCWGFNDSGQLGNGTQTDSAVPVEVTGLVDVWQLAMGHLHSCALLRATKKVVCWGRNNAGQLGIGESPPFSAVPQQVTMLNDVSSIAAGSEHNCARHTNDSALSCWGDNFVNQLGDGSTANRRTPVSVAGF